MKARVTLVLWVVLALAIAATQGNRRSDGHAASTPTPAGAITRTVLIGATPASAPGESLQLARIVIQPGTTLPAHVHPGTQLAWIESGELTYYVVSGPIEIHRNSAGNPPGAVEYLASGSSTVLAPGDAVIERAGLVHYGANLGAEPVVILTSTLFAADEPATIVQATPVS